MISGQLILDGIQWRIVEGRIPKAGPDGVPNGETVPVKSLLVKDGHSGLVVELRMTPEAFDEFAAAVSGRKVIVPGNGIHL